MNFEYSFQKGYLFIFNFCLPFSMLTFKLHKTFEMKRTQKTYKRNESLEYVLIPQQYLSVDSLEQQTQDTFSHAVTADIQATVSASVSVFPVLFWGMLMSILIRENSIPLLNYQTILQPR